MTVEIIQANYQNQSHCKDLLFLLNAYAEDPMGGNEPLSEYTQEHLISQLQSRKNVFSLLCYVDGNPAAICNCVEGFSTFKAKPLLNIHDMGVLPKYRGQGLSQKLMDEVEKIAVAKGCCKITLEVLEGNKIAQNSYLKFGFSGYELDPKHGAAMFWEKAL